MTTEQASITPALDEERAIATLTTAFSNDPITRWVYPGAHDYLSYFPRLAHHFAGGAFANDGAHAAMDFGGVALWLAPGVASDEEAMGALLDESIPDARKEEMFGFLGQMEQFHPTDAHWYLPLIGVDPSMQGQGLGSALLRHALERCDRERLPAYLEASSPLNKALYQRHGFEEIGVIQSASSPPMWPMLRKPR